MKKALKAILAAALAAVSLTVGVCAAWAADQAVFSNEPTSTFTTNIYNYPVEQTVSATPGSSTEEPTEPAAPAFTDVAADSVYNRAISWVVTEGITAGKTADTFDPDGICTRGNIVTFLYRALAQ